MAKADVITKVSKSSCSILRIESVEMKAVLALGYFVLLGVERIMPCLCEAGGRGLADPIFRGLTL